MSFIIFKKVGTSMKKIKNHSNCQCSHHKAIRCFSLDFLSGASAPFELLTESFPFYCECVCHSTELATTDSELN
jgi:hypothetical protein